MNDVQLKCTIQKIDKFTYHKDGKQKQGCDITLKDQTGKISLMLWNQQVNQINTELEGKQVKISKANSSTYEGELQLGFYDEIKIEKLKENSN